MAPSAIQIPKSNPYKHFTHVRYHFTDAMPYRNVRKSKTTPIRKAGNVPNGPDCDPNPNNLGINSPPCSKLDLLSVRYAHSEQSKAFTFYPQAGTIIRS